MIANQLSVAGNNLWPSWQGFLLSGGQLSVSNIVLTSLARFAVTGGTLNQSGTLSVANAYLTFGPGTWQLGPLQLNTGDNANSAIYLSSGTGNVQFGDSHNLGWSNQATLGIENWSGSLNGGGAQRVLFGNSASSLTSQQLGQIQFVNPAGCAPGVYPARILATGEITPGGQLNVFRSGGGMVMQWDDGFILQTATNVSGPFFDMTGVTSPYANQWVEPHRFFRLRHP